MYEWHLKAKKAYIERIWNGQADQAGGGHQIELARQCAEKGGEQSDAVAEQFQANSQPE